MPSSVLAAMHRSLLLRLVGWFLGLSLVTLVLVAATAFIRSRDAMSELIAWQLGTVAEDKAGEVVRWMEEQRHDLEFVAGLPTIRQAAGAMTAAQPAFLERRDGPLSAHLDSAAARALDVEELFVLSAVGGRVIASTARAHVGEYRTGDGFFLIGRDSTVVQPVYPSPSTARPTVTIATPIRDPDGATVAVLAAHLNFARIDETIGQSTGLGTTGEAYLVSLLNDFVNAERFGNPAWRRGVHTVGVDRALARESGTAEYANYADVPVIGAWRWIEPLELALLVEITQSEAFAPTRRSVGAIVTVGVVSVLLLALTMVTVARRIVRPVRAIADAATRVAQGDFHVRAPVTTLDEVGQLAQSFNEMTSRLRSLYENLHDQVNRTRDALRALEESRALLQALVYNSSNGVAVFDAAGRFLLVNARFTEYMGPNAAGLIGHPAQDVLPGPAGTVYQDMARRALEGRRSERDLQLGGAGGRSLQLIAFPLLDPEQRPFGAGVIAVDLSERRRAEEQRLALEARVQHAQRLESLGILAGGIAHDFNNLLGAILAHVTLVRDQLPADAPARADLEQAIDTTERAAQLTHQLLAYAGKASLAVATFDLNDAIHELGDLLAVSLPGGVRVTLALADHPVPLRADPGQVQQVILNLMTNAAEAVRPEGGHVTLRTALLSALEGTWQVTPSGHASWAALIVQDDGRGMDVETRNRIFDPFFSTKATGRGLGLAAVMGIVTGAGGGLRVESSPGAGTTMTVLFPATTDTPERRAAERLEGIRLPADLTVLLADDEPTVRRAAARILRRAGATVLEAGNGREAVTMFTADRDRIQAVILDVSMPELNGREAYIAIRAQHSTVPVIFSSGYDEQDVGRMEGDPNVTFLPKPYRAETLIARVRDAAGFI